MVHAYANAHYKDGLVFGIVEQAFEGEALDLDDPCFAQFKDQIRYTRVEPRDSQGCCWARALVQEAYGGEEYYMQVDSHTGWEINWDLKFMSAYAHLKQFHDKPLITCYPSGMSAEDDDVFNNPLVYGPNPVNGLYALVVGDNDTQVEGDEVTVTGSLQDGFLDQNSNNYKFSTKARVLRTTTGYCHGYLFSANTAFTSGSFVEEVPYDPELLFIGEEPSLALRAWTNGYNIFHMKDIPTRHYYGRDYRGTFWDPQNNPDVWLAKEITSDIRLADLYQEKIKGIYGLGSKRSLGAYIRYCGIDYRNKTFETRAYTGNVVHALDYKKQLETEEWYSGEA